VNLFNEVNGLMGKAKGSSVALLNALRRLSHRQRTRCYPGYFLRTNETLRTACRCCTPLVEILDLDQLPRHPRESGDPGVWVRRTTLAPRLAVPRNCARWACFRRGDGAFLSGGGFNKFIPDSRVRARAYLGRHTPSAPPGGGGRRVVLGGWPRVRWCGLTSINGETYRGPHSHRQPE
jgi:hypothetical protein